MKNNQTGRVLLTPMHFIRKLLKINLTVPGKDGSGYAINVGREWWKVLRRWLQQFFFFLIFLFLCAWNSRHQIKKMIISENTIWGAI